METHLLIYYLLSEVQDARHFFHALKEEGNEQELHDFRVVLRRIRSLSKLFCEDSISFPKALKAVMKRTNPIRELDVLLDSLALSEYPELSKQLSKLRKKIYTTLFTPEFTEHTFSSIDRYSAVLSEKNTNLTPESMKQKVLIHYHSCLNQYHTLKNDSAPKELHRLRIHFKDARYGLEFLQSSGILECEEMIHHCKQLQNVLGEFHDTLNQVQWLKKFHQKYPSREAKKLLRKRKKSLKKMRRQISKNV